MLAIRVLRDGLPVREQLFKDLPVRIGRSADNDLILADASVSRRHATLERHPSGDLVLVDGAGTNGLYAGPKRIASERFSGRLRARLGLCEIEIDEVMEDATQPVSLEDLHRLDQRRTPLTWAKYLTIAISALTLETALWPEFWSPWNSERVVSVVWQSAAALAAMLVAGSIVLGLLRAASRKARMADVLQHFAAYAWLLPLAALASLLGYYFVSDGLATWLRFWLPAFAGVAFLSQAAAIRRPPPSLRFRCLWAAAALLIFAGFEFTRSYAERRMGEPRMDHAVQSPLPGVGPGRAVSFDEYSASVEAAGKRSEAQVQQQPLSPTSTEPKGIH